MARALFDLSELDLSKNVLPVETIRAHLPHRHEFEMIDGVCHLDLEEGRIVSYKDWDDNPWWGRGHIPGRPLMPGVLQCEGAAQTATLLLKLLDGMEPEQFIGLGGLENTRFRGQITPPSRVYFASCRGRRSGNRVARYPAQAFCNGKLVMDMTLLGVLL